MVDSPGFYLSQRGHADPVDELKETHKALTQAGFLVPGRGHPAACVFPARLDFLLRKGLIKPEEVPDKNCPQTEQWLADRKYASMWLVFSSWYPENPASMFGHTFLRFRRTDRASDLLDDAVNFAALVQDFDSFAYPIKGLLGGFSGHFSMTPYHLKINEYNDVESRDLWEYRISADPAQIRRVMLSLFEVGSHGFNYFYLDENCSWLMLKVMETGDPSWNFMPDFKFWVVPVDTVRWAVEARGPEVVTQSRMSMQQKFLQRFEMLGPDGKKRFDEVVKLVGSGRDVTPFEDPSFHASSAVSDPDGQRRLLDALLDWVDFKDSSGTDKLKGVAALRRVLLRERTAIKASPPDPLVPLPASANPIKGHGSTHVRLGAVCQPDGKTRGAFSWTPALHELIAPPSGYAKGLEVSMFRMGAWWDDASSQPVINDLGLLRVRALNPWNAATRPKSWFVDATYTTDRTCPAHARGCQRTSVSGGRGISAAVSMPGGWADLYGAFFLQGETGRLRRRDDIDRWFAGAGPSGEIWYGGNNVRLEYGAAALRAVDEYSDPFSEWEQYLRAGISLTLQSDLRIGWNRRGLSASGKIETGDTLSVMAGWYF